MLAHRNPEEGHDETGDKQHAPQSAEEQSGTSAERPGGISRLRTRSGSCCEGLRGEDSIAELCRREGIVQNLYYRWSKDFLEAGKKRLAGDTARAATSDEVKDLRARGLASSRRSWPSSTLENRLLKKSVMADGEDDA